MFGSSGWWRVPCPGVFPVIDWLTLILPLEGLPVGLRRALVAYRDRVAGQVIRVAPGGEVSWRAYERASIRSDSHVLTVHVGERLELYGSPARSAGLPNNVFGPCDLGVCAEAHVAAVEAALGFGLPRDGWRVSRVDVTENYDLGGPSAVRQALAVLRHAAGGRYVLRDTGDTVYWGKRSGGRAGKAYAKGPHLLRQVSRGEAVASLEDVALAHRLLRLELTVGRKALGRLGVVDPFGSLVDWSGEHVRYFAALVGGCEVVSMDALFSRVLAVAPTERQGLAALGTLGRVRLEGVEVVKASLPARTWHRHKSILFAAGLSWADLSAGRVVELRRAPLLLGAPVCSWDELRRVA